MNDRNEKIDQLEKMIAILKNELAKRPDRNTVLNSQLLNLIESNIQEKIQTLNLQGEFRDGNRVDIRPKFVPKRLHFYG